ncbi:MAG TPA: redoxin domain-containing protein [Gemmatimonadales bacterium]|nr:redoxin domain-containing protein [Gemmatimonadales bacterium]
MNAAGDTPVRVSGVRMEVGEPFPVVRAHRLGGGKIVLPGDVADRWAVILFYRGNWCPYCRQQLADFQEHLDRFRAADVSVIALSADPEVEARTTVEELGIEFQVGYGLAPVDIEKTLGTYLGRGDAFIQATGFVLSPKGRTALAVYSSGAVGRLVANDVLGLIDYAKKQV